MSIAHNKKLVKNAQTLRKNMTDEEKHLWYDFLKKLPFTVKGIVIELDGSQHLNTKKPKKSETPS